MFLENEIEHVHKMSSEREMGLSVLKIVVDPTLSGNRRPRLREEKVRDDSN